MFDDIGKFLSSGFSRRVVWVVFIVFLMSPMFLYAEDCSTIQVGLLPFGQLTPKDKAICGLRFNVFGGDNAGLKGLDIGLVNIAGKATGVQIGIVNWLDKRNDDVSSSGLQLGGWNAASEYSGVQLGAVNIVGNKFSGVQVGITSHVWDGTATGVQASIWYNDASSVNGTQIAIGGNNLDNDIKGVQLGAINISHGHVTGGQIGLLNFAKYLTGFQIGLINVVYGHADAIPFFPIINVGWH
jgi:hypothetical protein